MAFTKTLRRIRTQLSRKRAKEAAASWRVSEMLPILRADGTPVTDFASPATWRHRGKQQPIYLDDILAETHHRTYGRPWLMGRLYYDELRRRGLLQSDRFLDVGCGAGRLGIHVIPYLDAGHYCGIEPHLQSLVAFAAYEARMHALFERRPRLLLDDAFSFSTFGETFDVAVDFYVTRHLGPELTRTCYTKARAVMRPGGRLFVLHTPSIEAEALHQIGWSVASRETVRYRIPAIPRHAVRLDDEWHTLVAV